MVNRKTLVANGYHPIEYADRTKFPLEKEWQINAMKDPSPLILRGDNPRKTNTGLMANGLVPIDIDLPNGDMALIVGLWCQEHFSGYGMIRTRANSSKMLMLYRAEFGEPPKRLVLNDSTKDRVEVLGKGNQFLAFGNHDSGVKIEWMNDHSPEIVPRSALGVVTEAQVEELLIFCADLIGTTVRPLVVPIFRPVDDEDLWEIGDVASALAQIPNYLKDWDLWFRVLGATHAVTGGSAEGYHAFETWAAQSGANVAAKNLHKWMSVSEAAMFFSGGTLFHLARAANPDWFRPSRRGFDELPTFGRNRP